MDIAKFLRDEVSLFKTLPQRTIDRLIDQSNVITFEEHEAVIEYGSEGHFVGILMEGEAEVSIYDDSGTKQRIGKLQRGDLFGEMSLMSGDRTIADVVGLSRCRALLIPDSAISEILVENQDLVAELSSVIQGRLSTILTADRNNLVKRALRKSLDPYGLTLKRPGPGCKILALSRAALDFCWSLHETAQGKLLAAGVFKELGTDKSHLILSTPGAETRIPVPNPDIKTLFRLICDALFGGAKKIIAGPEEITAVGHHLVSGGETFQDSALIDEETLQKLDAQNPLMKEQNTAGIQAIVEARSRFKSARHIAVFDSSFHATLPPFSFLFALPFELFKEKGIRRTGYHGLAHQFAALKAAQFLNRPYNELEVAVVCLDEESSICAVDHGRSVDVSAGFSPSEGLVSMNSPGSIDPALPYHLAGQAGFSPRETEVILKEKSGLRGLSGITGGFGEIEAHAELGHHRALLSYKLFGYAVRRKIGEAMAAMGGLDVVVFTGEIGYQSSGVRSLACQGLSCMGINLDEKRNRTPLENDNVAQVSGPESPVKVLVVRPNRTLMVAREAIKALKTETASHLLKKQESIPVPLEVSAHHVHLAQEHIEALYGKGAQLEVEHELSQPGQYASRQTVTLVGPKGVIERVRVLGPARSQTQVEIAMTEQFKLGIEPPVRESGDLENSPGITIEGPAGTVTLAKGVICARRHIHLSQEEALRFGFHDKDVVRVRVSGDRELIFGDVLVRVNPAYRLAMHIDTDEANASHIHSGEIGYIEEIQSRV